MKKKTKMGPSAPFKKFSELDLPKPLRHDLEKMKFIEPTPVQAAAIPPGLKGRDILGSAQTGTGKTAAFGIPLLAQLYHRPDTYAVILAPTRELAAQIHQVLGQMSRGMKMHGTLIVGGESFGRQVHQLDRGTDFIVATPGRLNDHLQQGTVDLQPVRFLVLDEVDRMLDMGFAPQIRQIMRYVPKKRQTFMFSATLPREILSLANSFLHNPVRVAIEREKETEMRVTEKVVRASHFEKDGALLKELKQVKGKVLVFTRTKRRTEPLARLLRRHGYHVAILHGDIRQSQRKRALNNFRTGSHPILIATDIAGRGIDVDDIVQVINYDVPKNRDDYIHRIGRTGRLGKKGSAVTFLTPQDVDGLEIIYGERAPKRPKSRFSKRSFGSLRRGRYR